MIRGTLGRGFQLWTGVRGAQTPMIAGVRPAGAIVVRRRPRNTWWTTASAGRSSTVRPVDTLEGTVRVLRPQTRTSAAGKMIVPSIRQALDDLEDGQHRLSSGRVTSAPRTNSADFAPEGALRRRATSVIEDRRMATGPLAGGFNRSSQDAGIRASPPDPIGSTDLPARAARRCPSRISGYAPPPIATRTL
jgi:hypothetical protein